MSYHICLIYIKGGLMTSWSLHWSSQQILFLSQNFWQTVSILCPAIHLNLFIKCKSLKKLITKNLLWLQYQKTNQKNKQCSYQTADLYYQCVCWVQFGGAFFFLLNFQLKGSSDNLWISLTAAAKDYHVHPEHCSPGGSWRGTFTYYKQLHNSGLNYMVHWSSVNMSWKHSRLFLWVTKSVLY